MIPLRQPRKTIGQITYDRDARTHPDPEKEKLRQDLFAAGRRQQVGHMARDHLRRIVREDGLAISIRQLFDKNGRPPPDVTLATILRLYRMLEKQHGWLRAIVVELHDHLKTLDHVRYRKESAQIAAALREKRSERAAIYAEIAARDGMPDIPEKVRQDIARAINLDMSARERLREGRRLPVALSDMLGSRLIQKVMKFVFVDYLPATDKSVPDDAAAQYEYVSAALTECEALVQVIGRNLYDLQEFVESADLISQQKD